MPTQHEADESIDKIKQDAGDAADKIKQQAQAGLEKAGRAAEAQAEDAKERAASHMQDFAQAIRRASDELSEREHGAAAGIVTEAVGGLERVASAVSGTSVPEMISSAQAFAKRNPTAFVMGSLLAGIALSRFAKASGDRPASGPDDSKYSADGHDEIERAKPKVGPANDLPHPQS